MGALKRFLSKNLQRSNLTFRLNFLCNHLAFNDLKTSRLRNTSAECGILYNIIFFVFLIQRHGVARLVAIKTVNGGWRMLSIRPFLFRTNTGRYFVGTKRNSMSAIYGIDTALTSMSLLRSSDVFSTNPGVARA